ncbi:MAG: InlB B-repeat-containing protein [Clostridia bacterium]|nr:InlB B-repeat-containing protein [Clostridia bacterium]
MKKTFLFLFVTLAILLCLTACGKEKKTLTFDVNGGEMYTTELEVVVGKTYTLPTPRRTGHRFLGWYDGEQKVETQGKWDESTETHLVAKWEFAQYKITYDLAGGEHSAYDVVEGYNSESAPFTIHPPTKENNFFSHWVDQNGKKYYGNIEFPTGSEGDFDFTAVWWDFVDPYGVKYEYVNDELRIVDYVGDGKYDVRIHETIYGKKITGINEGAFSKLGALVNDYGYIFRVYLPRTLTEIEKNAFKDCDNIKVLISTTKKENYKDVANEWLLTAQINTVGNENLKDVILLNKPCLGASNYVEID